MENVQETIQNDANLNSSDANQNNLQQTQQPASPENSELILGKFKSIEDLTNAYKNIESQHGQQSKEIGELRKKAETLDGLQKQFVEATEKFNGAKDYIVQTVEKYNDEQYFKNPEFNNLFQEAFVALGSNLDADKFVSLLDKYVNARIGLHERAKSAKSETENVKSQMKFSDSATKETSKPLPKVQTMSPEMIDEFVAKYI